MIDRRAILTGSAGIALAAAGPNRPASAAQPAPARSGGAPDVVVVGAGAFGGWTALSLRERGLKVLSLDAYGPSNPRAASAGETRSIRSGYGSDGFYSAWAAKALTLWNQRQAEFGRTLLYPNDRLELAATWLPEMVAQRRIFDDLKIPYEVLERAQLRSRYPQMNFDDVEFAFIEKTSAAVIKARESMIVVSEVFQKKGGEFRIARAMPGPATGRRMTALTLNGGDRVSAGQFVFACGPWSPKVLPTVMGPKIGVNRSEYYYWGVPAGDDRFSWPKQPAWHDHIRGGYGFGSIERGLKYSPSGGGQVPQDPDNAERLPTAHILKRGRDYIGHRFPDMRDAPILETRVCQMESPANSHFIIDRHPDFDNVWIASGGGGHGFKHGPMVGEYVADRLMGRQTDAETDRLFRLATHPDRTSRSAG
jgi:glycine/D-amino acid oxidase-like deaminating enzyme